MTKQEVRGDLRADETVLYLHWGNSNTTYVFVKTPRTTWLKKNLNFIIQNYLNL